MSDKPKFEVDSDWKEEARKEKERLAEMEEEMQGAAPPEPSFPELVNVLVMQAAIGLNGLQTPTGETIPPNIAVAKHYIDLLGVLAEKTKGNLTPEEDKMMAAVLYELRMHFVATMQAATQPPLGTTEPRP